MDLVYLGTVFLNASSVRLTNPVGTATRARVLA